MSTDIFELEISAHAKLIYVILEKYRNRETGLCFPSLDTIALNASLCRNSVIKAIKELEETGVIEIHKTRPKGARYTVNSYRNIFHSAQFDRSNDRSNDRSRGAPKLIKLKNSNTVLTDTSLSNTKIALTEPITKNEKFEIFWIAYPKQRAGSKHKSYLAWKKAIEKVSPEHLNQVCKIYANSDEVRRGFAKGCAAWLNDERWTTDYTTKPQGNQNATNNHNLTKAQRADIALGIANAGTDERMDGSAPDAFAPVLRQLTEIR